MILYNFVSTNDRHELNKNLAQMLKGGVIMDVVTPQEAEIAQEAGAVSVMALESCLLYTSPSPRD